MKDEVTYKLSDFLQKNRVFTEESQVVYTLVEVRKLLDHYGATAPLVKFYADWAVHTRKDRVRDFKAIAETLFDQAKKDIKAKFPALTTTPSPIVAFAHGDHSQPPSMTSCRSTMCQPISRTPPSRGGVL